LLNLWNGLLLPDANPLDYFFWDLVKSKVYKRSAGEPFKSEEELKFKKSCME